jgi:hypothetical protein
VMKSTPYSHRATKPIVGSAYRAVVIRYQVADGCRSAASCSPSGEIAVVLSARNAGRSGRRRDVLQKLERRNR